MFREVHEHPIQGGPLCVAEFFSAQIRARHFQMGCGPEDGMAWIPPQSDMRGINRDQFPDLCQPGADILCQDRVRLLRKLFEHHFHCFLLFDGALPEPWRSYTAVAWIPRRRQSLVGPRQRMAACQAVHTAQVRSFHRPARHQKTSPPNFDSRGRLCGHPAHRHPPAPPVFSWRHAMRHEADKSPENCVIARILKPPEELCWKGPCHRWFAPCLRAFTVSGPPASPGWRSPPSR